MSTSQIAIPQFIQKHSPSFVVFLLTLLIYGFTAVPDLTWAFGSGDGGELITAAVSGGIPHPPGYPTYLLLGKLVALLPVEPIAYRFNLFSALCGAVATAMATATAKPLGLTGWRSTLAGFTFAFIPLVWQQAIVTEVYALNLAMVSFFLWGLFSKRASWLVGLFLGLCLTTHLTSAILLPLAFLMQPVNRWLQFVGGLLFGLTPFLLLPWLAAADSHVIWGSPETVTGWWWLVSAKIYQPNQFALPNNQLWGRAGRWAILLLRQLLFIGWPLLLWGIQQEAERQRVWWGLFATAVGYLFYAFSYNTVDALVLTLPAWLLLSLCLIAAFKRLGRNAFLLPFVFILLNFGLVRSEEIIEIRPFAEQILNSSPPTAILITSGDPDIFTLWYFHHAEGQRPDIFIVDDQLFAFDWYRTRIAQMYPALDVTQQDDLAQFRTANGDNHPICDVSFFVGGQLTVNIDCDEEP